MSITFYSMNGCGFCGKAKKMFANEIADGTIIVKDKSEATSPKIKGFPAFEYNGKIHLGLPSSKQALHDALGYKGSSEGYAGYREGFYEKKGFRPPSEWIGVI